MEVYKTNGKANGIGLYDSGTVLPKPAQRFDPLPLDDNAMLLRYVVNLKPWESIEQILLANDLLPSFYNCEKIGEGYYLVSGHYTCPP